MFQNIKVDIIYYKTNTDFEMEFNLCGCCRMRLLTDKSSDKKNLVHNLARAVSRSRVIIIVGALFGDDGIIGTTAQAIGKTLSTVDNRHYGIAGDDEISVINGATPLVTQDGYFGGCIIESGPQSMILLSENKTVRKAIMNTLIHPYIEELCAIELKAKASEENGIETSEAVIPEVTPVLPDSNAELPNLSPSADDIPAVDGIIDSNDTAPEFPDTNEAAASSDGSTDDINADKATLTSIEVNTPVVEPPVNGYDSKNEPLFSEIQENESENTDKTKPEANEKAVEKPLPPPEENIQVSGKMIFETDDYRAEATDLNAYAEKAKQSKPDSSDDSSLMNADQSSDNIADVFFDYEDIDFSAPKKKPKPFSSSNLPILIISILLLVIIAVLCYCIFYIPSREGVSATAYLQETFKDFF